MMKNYLSKFLVLILLSLIRTQVSAQTPVYADQLISNSADFQNPERAVDANRTNYAYISNLLTVLPVSDIRVRFPEYGSAGDVVNVTVQGSAGLLSTGVLDRLTLKLYDSAGTTPVATASSASVLSLSLLSGGTYLYNLQFITSIADNYKFREAKLEISNLLSVSLTSFRVYGFQIQKPCPPVYANSVIETYATPLLASVDNADRITDANPNNYASLYTTISLLTIGSARVDLGFPIYARGGDYIGCTIASSTGLLDADILGGLTLVTYDASGTVKETISGSSLLQLKLLAGTTDKYTVGFKTTAGNYRISKIRLVKTAVVGLLTSIRLYNAFYYSLNRPPVTITPSGPLNFCDGGNVTLTAYDSLGATNYVWSNGATGSSITVSESGTYYVSVQDSFACTRSSAVLEVTKNPLPNPVITGDTILCGTGTGIIGVPAYFASSLWNTGATTRNISATVGRYYVSVTDTNGCKGSDTVDVRPNRLGIAASVTPATCVAGTNGAIALTVSGGSGTYTYQWSTGATTSSVSGLRPGLYSVTVTDNTYSCAYRRDFTVTAANTLSLQHSISGTSACGKSDGKISLNVIGGGGSYSYAWSTGASGSVLSSIPAGRYTVSVTDAASSCVLRDTFGVDDGPATQALSLSTTAATSCSAPNGAASVSVSGGSGTYSYLWSTGAATAAVSGLRPGAYYVSVKDASSSCVKTARATVADNAALTVNATVKAASCGMANGSVTINSVSGGTGPYTYAWAGGSSAAVLSGLRAGVYSLSVSDGGSTCTGQQLFAVSDSSGPALSATVTQPDCGTNGNGSISVASLPANTVLRWSNGGTGSSVSGLKPGTYSLTATDTTTQCTSVSVFELRAKTPVSVSAVPVANTSCLSAPNGRINVSILGGAAPYTYSWSSGEATQNLSGKAPGNYTLSVTDANGCSGNITLPLQTDSSKLLRAVVASITKASCNTSASGAVSVNVSGGATPYTYSWSPGGAATKDLSGVVPGVYNLTVTDALGCKANLSAAVTIDSPAALKVVLDSTKASGCSSSATGAVYITVSAGTAPYTYEWRKGGAFVAATADLVNVVAGSYTVTVTDASGCSATLNASVGVLPGTIVVTQDSVKRPTCTLSGDGAVYTSVSGGLAPYTYSWSSGQITDDITGVNAGTYVITATDANGCPGQLIVTLNYDTAKTVKVVADSTRGAACAAGTGAAIYVTASGGTAPYAYAWSTGAAVEDLMNVPVGAYRLTVTDARGCKVNLDVNTSVDTARSLRLTLTGTDGAACIGSKTGSITTDVARGTAPYTFLWSTGAVGKTLTNVAPGSYTVTVMDGEGCSASLTASLGIDTAKRVRIAADSVRGAGCAAGSNGGLFVSVSGGTPAYTYLWSDGSTMQDLINAKPGLYSLRVQDVYGCTAEYSGNITIDPAKAINVTTATVTDAACSGNASGAIDINVSGGQAPYSYDWSNGATTKVVSGLIPGSYTVKVTDAAGCTGELSVNIRVDTMNKIKLSVISQTAARCAGSASGAVTVKVEGGVAPYNYSWSSGAKTKDLSYVAPGSYLLTVTDAQGCSADLSVVIGIDASNPVKVAIDSVRGVGCGDTLSGALFASASGGVPPYSYLWSTGAVTKDLVNVSKGNYMLTVTDDAGCSASTSAVVNLLSALQLTASVTPVDCYGNASGAASVSAGKGSGNYTYAWSDGVTGAIRTGLTAGTYRVTVIDELSKCTADSSVRITQNDSLLLTLTVQSDSCLPGADGAITVNISGGTTPYSFAWSNGQVSQNLQGLEAGPYTLTVTDARNCIARAAAQVASVDCNTEVVVHDVLTPNGDGMNDAFFIEGIVFYPQNKLQIVDKWGDLVYERSPYDNSFTGVNSKTGDVLPTGTYYYILQLNAPGKTKEQNTFKGAVLLKR